MNDRERDLLAAVVFADEMGEDSNALDQAAQCLRALEAQNREMQRASLREKIKAAERNGDLSEALRLTEEFNRCSVIRNR